MTSTLKDTLIVTLISPDGISSIQYATAGAARTPLRGAIACYANGAIYSLDYSQRAYGLSTIVGAVERQSVEDSRVTESRPGGAQAPSSPPSLPPPTLRQLTLTTQIQGTSTQAYQISAYGQEWRVWYATALPLPPQSIVVQLAKLVPGGSMEVAGHLPLRAELLLGSDWKVVFDTQDIRHTQVRAADLAPPAGFHSGPFIEAALSSTSATSAASAARLAAPGAVRTADLAAALAQRARVDHEADRGGKSQTDIDAPPQLPAYQARSGGGPVSTHPTLWSFFWGQTFADPTHQAAVGELVRSLNAVYQTRFEGSLGQYGINGGSLELPNNDVDSGNPDPSVGNANFIAAAAFVIKQGLTTNAPMFWWMGHQDDPIYAVFVPASVVESGSWDGYHFAAGEPAGSLIPFPLNFLVHDAMPYLIVKVPDVALGFPTYGVRDRRQCLGPAPLPALCAALPAFDGTTETATHEVVEAATDPYPFFGWSDVGQSPVWENGELADLCAQHPPLPRTSLVNNIISGSNEGAISVSAYWSNQDNACVPASQAPTLTVVEPQAGETVSWQAGGARIGMYATATDPLEGPLTNIRWSVDGSVIGTGTAVTASQLALGSHTITATVTNSVGLSAAASIPLTVSALPPTAVITAPLDGASFGTDQTIPLHGYGLDAQDQFLPDASLVWKVNGTVVGTGPLATAQITQAGSAAVKLTVINSAGLSTTTGITLHITPGQGNPSVAITAPTRFGIAWGYGVNDLITFQASAHDATNHPIPDAQIAWRDDIDGFLGTGAGLVTKLSGYNSRPHHVTVTVTDSAGKTNSDTIEIFVQVPIF